MTSLTCCICARSCEVNKVVYYYHLRKPEYTFLCSKKCRSIRRQRIEAIRASQRNDERKTKEKAKKQKRKADQRELDKLIKDPKNNKMSDNIIIRNIEDVIKKRKAGMTLRKLAEQYGVSHENVRTILILFKIKSRPKEYTCDHCGNKIPTKRKYCCLSCKNMALYSDKQYSKFTFVKLTCDGCGETFERSNQHIEIAKRNKLYNTPEKYAKKKNYCKRACFSKHTRSKNVIPTDS